MLWSQSRRIQRNRPNGDENVKSFAPGSFDTWIYLCQMSIRSFER